jgi:uncharacterized protein YqjF (DUF2071 family)
MLRSGAPHRVLPLSVQTWSALTFVHWPYEPASLRPLLPAGLELDLFEGKAWVGLVPFLLTVRPASRLLPALPGIASIPETNVRTYVRDARGGRGIWFFSLDITQRLFVAAARATYGLPYRWSRMSVDRRGLGLTYTGRRRAGPGGYVLRVEVDEEEVATDPLLEFLTARWRLYTVLARSIFEARVEHPPWRLRRARVIELEEDILQACGVPGPSGPPLAHHAAEIEARVGPPRPLLVRGR